MYLKKDFKIVIDKLNLSKMDTQLIAEITKICKYAVQANMHFSISSELKHFIKDILVSFVGEPEHERSVVATNISDFTSFLWWRKFLETFFKDCELTDHLIRETDVFVQSSVFCSQELLEEELLEIAFLTNTLSQQDKEDYRKRYETLMTKRLFLSDADLSIIGHVIGIVNHFEKNNMTESLFYYYNYTDDLDMMLNYATMFHYRLKHHKNQFENFSISQIVGSMILQEGLE